MKALVYLRTSSAANVGQDKDSHVRQMQAIEAYAASAGVELVATFYDAAVSGVDAIETRPGFAALLDRIESNGIRAIMVEHGDRFARDMLASELGLAVLRARGVALYDASGNELTNSTDPMKVMFRQITASFSQYEKARLVEKLAKARQRKREATGKCEGRKTLTETNPTATALAKQLGLVDQRKRHLAPSLRSIAATLADAGHVSASGKPFGPSAIAKMLAS